MAAPHAFAGASSSCYRPVSPLVSPTTNIGPGISSPRSNRKPPRPRRSYSQTSDDSPVDSREGSPSYSGPWRDERRRPPASPVYDLPSAVERSAAISRSSSSESSTSPVQLQLERTTLESPGRPALSFKPASPTQASMTTAAVLSTSPLSLSPGSFASPSSKRQRNKKLLSLNIAVAAAPSAAGLLATNSLSRTRSCPPSPLLVEGSSKDLDDMRANVRGDVKMSRRTSIPRLGGMGTASPAAEYDRPSPVRLIGRSGEDGMDEADEPYPYANGPREILSGVYLGSEQNAKDAHSLQALGISYILNVAKEVPCPWTAEATIKEEEEEPEAGAARPTPRSAASSSSCSSESPTHSDESISPSSAGTTLSAASHTASSHIVDVDSKDLPRPHYIRFHASTPNLQASSSDVKIDLSTSVPLLPHAKNLTLQGVQYFMSNGLTGRPAIEYLHLPWGHDEDNLVARFPTAFAFVDRAKATGGKVLIHCQCGVSRSATAVIAYVMREASTGQCPALAGITGMHEAYQWVKDKSAWITPNMSLLYQLREWEQALSAIDESGLTSPTTPSSLKPALAALETPFYVDQDDASKRPHQMDVDSP